MKNFLSPSDLDPVLEHILKDDVEHTIHELRRLADRLERRLQRHGPGHRRRLTKDEVAKVRASPARGVSQRQVCQHFNIGRSAAYRVIAGKTHPAP